MTPFGIIIDKFLSKITDDMYLELTEEDTIRDAKQFLLGAIPYFEFPRFALYDYDETQNVYNVDLTPEEINIFALCMKEAWLDRQINSVENTRMKYSGSDFKFTSQANHLAKLLTLKAENHRENIHAQRLYKRHRIEDNGRIQSNWDIFNQSALNTTSIPQISGLPVQPIIIPTSEPSSEEAPHGWEPITMGEEDAELEAYWEHI